MTSHELARLLLTLPDLPNAERKNMNELATRDREWTPDGATAHIKKCLASNRLDNIADALSLLQCMTMIAESALTDEFDAQPGFEHWEHFTFDYYDMSFEVFGLPDDYVATPEQVARFLELGFRQFWTHEHSRKRREPGERFYRQPPGPGR